MIVTDIKLASEASKATEEGELEESLKLAS